MADEPSPPRPVFFVHVMKTGGISLLESLRQHFEPGEVYPDPLDLVHLDGQTVAFRHFTIRYLQQLPPARRERIRVYTGHFPYVVCEALGGGFDTLTLLREPVARTISLLRQFHRPAPWLDPARPPRLAPLSLEEVYEQPHVFEPLVHNHQTKLFSMTMADRPSGYLQVIDVDEHRLAVAKRTLAEVDVLGLTERYDDFLDHVQARWGWALPRGVHVNAAPDGDPSISATLRRRIEADNALDIELYEHAKELVADRLRG